ncbi:hypothetical protein CXF33_05380 [Corynebacterium bovis]|nr:hypothetical protein CXF33_05380 [Corynebacterium bovis]
MHTDAVRPYAQATTVTRRTVAPPVAPPAALPFTLPALPPFTLPAPWPVAGERARSARGDAVAGRC